MTFQEYKSAYWSMPASYRVGEMPTQIAMYDSVDGFIADCAFNLVKDMEICPNSLGENGLPMDYSETEHKWYKTTNFEGETIMECSECGSVKELEDNDQKHD